MSSELERLEERQTGEPILEVENLSKYFQSDTGLLAGVFGSEDVEAVDDVSFTVNKGETLALVGESGCGKSTLARAVLQLIEPTEGTVRFKGIDLTEQSARATRPLRRDMQMIFQDPQASLNPRMKVGQIIEEPMKAHEMYDKTERRERARELLERVELEAAYYNRYPHEFSGGQRQRINLARAMSTDPDLIMCDEPVSALDVSVQAQVLNTMRDLQEEFGLTYVVISHDLSVVRYIADRVAVMYLGHIVELAEKEELFENPQHPYTKALLDAIPVPDPRGGGAKGTLEGDVPSPIDPPSGCRFRTRCPRLIAPDDYEWTDTTWDNTRTFMRAIKRRTVEPATAPELRSQYFADGEPDGEAGRIVNEALELASSPGDGESDESRTERLDEATELLLESFARKSICARERPHYELESEHGDGRHLAACHLHR